MIGDISHHHSGQNRALPLQGGHVHHNFRELHGDHRRDLLVVRSRRGAHCGLAIPGVGDISHLHRGLQCNGVLGPQVLPISGGAGSRILTAFSRRNVVKEKGTVLLLRIKNIILLFAQYFRVRQIETISKIKPAKMSFVSATKPRLPILAF